MTFGGINNAAQSVVQRWNTLLQLETPSSAWLKNLSKVLHTHTIKGGLYFEAHAEGSVGETPLPEVSIKFDRDTNNPLDHELTRIRNALLGVFDSLLGSHRARPQGQFRLFRTSKFFLQDTWKVRIAPCARFLASVFYHKPSAVRCAESAFVVHSVTVRSGAGLRCSCSRVSTPTM